MQYGNLIIQIRNLGLIIVFGARLFDLCLRLVQLRLTQLDNRTESESVPLLRKVHSQIGVVEFLPQRPRSLPFAVLYAIRAGSDRVLWVTARRGRRLQPKGTFRSCRQAHQGIRGQARNSSMLWPFIRQSSIVCNRKFTSALSSFQIWLLHCEQHFLEHGFKHLHRFTGGFHDATA